MVIPIRRTNNSTHPLNSEVRMGTTIQAALADVFPFLGNPHAEAAPDVGEHTYIPPAKLIEILEPVASMVGSSRISPDEAFHAIAGDLDDPVAREVCLSIARDIRRGIALSDAMSRFPRTFTSEVTAIVAVGAEGGMIAESLNEVATHLADDTKLWASVAKAARYPIFVLISFVGTLLATLTLVIPKEEGTFTDLMDKAPELMPAPTKILLWMSQAYRAHWISLSLIMIGAVVALMRYLKSYQGKQVLHRLLLVLPLTKHVTVGVIRARFLRHAARLIRSKKSSADAFALAARSITIDELAERYQELGPLIQEGLGVTEVLRESELFPRRILTYAQAGEQSGSLSEMLEKAARHETDEADKMLSKLLDVLPHYLLVAVAALVISLVYAQYAGIFAVNRYYQTIALHS